MSGLLISPEKNLSQIETLREKKPSKPNPHDILPKIPRALFDRSSMKTMLFLLYASSIWILPVSGIFILSQNLRSNWEFKLILIFCLALIAQHGLHLFGWIGHESFHFNLFKNKKNNVMTGLLFSSMILGHNGFGFALSHYNHHRYTNQALDPDWKIFSRYHTIFSRILLARLTADWNYFKKGIQAGFGKLDLDMKGFPLSINEIKVYARVNFFLSLFWLTVYSVIIVAHPVPGFYGIILPHLLVTLITGLRPYIEHAGTERELFTTSRTRTFPLLSFIYYFNNYHLEHHLYPHVPCYNLQKVHTYLKDSGVFSSRKIIVESKMLNNIRYGSSKFQYPR